MQVIRRTDSVSASMQEVIRKSIKQHNDIQEQLQKAAHPDMPAPDANQILLKEALKTGRFAYQTFNLYKEADTDTELGRIWVKKEIPNEKTGKAEEWLVVYTNDEEELIRQLASEQLKKQAWYDVGVHVGYYDDMNELQTGTVIGYRNGMVLVDSLDKGEEEVPEENIISADEPTRAALIQTIKKMAASPNPKDVPIAPGIKSKNITIDETGAQGTAKVTVEFTDVDKGLQFYKEQAGGSSAGDKVEQEDTAKDEGAGEDADAEETSTKQGPPQPPQPQQGQPVIQPGPMPQMGQASLKSEVLRKEAMPEAAYPEAHSIAKELRERYNGNFIDPMTTGYRVSVGNYLSQESAKKAADKISKDLAVNGPQGCIAKVGGNGDAGRNTRVFIIVPYTMKKEANQVAFDSFGQMLHEGDTVKDEQTGRRGNIESITEDGMCRVNWMSDNFADEGSDGYQVVDNSIPEDYMPGNAVSIVPGESLVRTAGMSVTTVKKMTRGGSQVIDLYKEVISGKVKYSFINEGEYNVVLPEGEYKEGSLIMRPDTREVARIGKIVKENVYSSIEQIAESLTADINKEIDGTVEDAENEKEDRKEANLQKNAESTPDDIVASLVKEALDISDQVAPMGWKSDSNDNAPAGAGPALPPKDSLNTDNPNDPTNAKPVYDSATDSGPSFQTTVNPQDKSVQIKFIDSPQKQNLDTAVQNNMNTNQQTPVQNAPAPSSAPQGLGGQEFDDLSVPNQF